MSSDNGNGGGASIVNAAFACALSKWIALKGWTVERLASEAGVSTITAQAWLEGKYRPRTKNLLTLRGLGFDPSVAEVMPERRDAEPIDARLAKAEAELARMRADFDALVELYFAESAGGGD